MKPPLNCVLVRSGSLRRIATYLIAAAAIAVYGGTRTADAGPFSNTVDIPVCPGVSVTGFVGNFPNGGAPGQMRQFLGLPYAAPPTGANRWNPPQPPSCPPAGNYTLPTTFAPPCPQLPSTLNEDCLYFNVFTPVEAGTYPVMVWIYGGGFYSGASDYYNPAELVSQGVIVVTFNYRVGALGFLAHPALDNKTTGNTGNYGIQDQQALLKVVHDGIAAFGGNPKKVTVFGESAGGTSTLIQLTSPKSRGLFSRAIAESGTVSFFLNTQTLAHAEKLGEKFASAVNCVNVADVASCLRALDVSTILNNQVQITLPQSNGAAPSPNVDGVVLKDTIQNVLSSGNFNKVPFINGTNHDEFRFFISQTPQFGTVQNGTFEDNIVPNNVTFPGAVTYTNALKLLSAKPVGAVESVYPGGKTDRSTNSAFAAAITDRDFACGALLTDTLVGNANVPIFAYEFNDEKAPPPGFIPQIVLHDGTNFSYGAYHSAELGYLFGASLSGPQTKLSNAMVAYWTTFAKTGNPNPVPNPLKLPVWPGFTGVAQEMLSLVPPTPMIETTFDSVHHCSSFWDKPPFGE
jgi:para-nitrobenzyl esterase